MRILFLNQFFWPDSAATGQLLTDLATHLAEQGLDVSVICGPNGYAEAPTGSAPPPVEIIRTPGLRFSRGVFWRLLSYASFLIFAAWYSLRARRPDIVVTMTTPPLLSLVGTLLGKLRGCRHFVWEMDMYPEVAVDLGVLDRRAWFTRWIGRVADSVRSNADGVLVLGDCMRDRLIERGMAPEKLHVAENWADGRTIRPMPPRNDGKLHVLYSGNLGLAHDIETVSGAMERLARDERLKFVFVGNGLRSKELRRWSAGKNLANLSFMPYQDREYLSESLGAGDIGLVTLNQSCSGSVVPSKCYSLMAAGRPILFIGPGGSTAARMIERFQCGWQIDNGDVDGVVALLQILVNTPSLIRQAGERARAAFLQHYDMPIGVSRVAKAMGVAPEREYTLDLEAYQTHKNPKSRSA